jgi:hypothetical protein
VPTEARSNIHRNQELTPPNIYTETKPGVVDVFMERRNRNEREE